MVLREDEKFDADLRKGRIAAETLMKPMTFFEAVEALKLPKAEEGGEKKKGDKKGGNTIISTQTHHLVTKIDLSGFKFLRFSKAGLQELIMGIDRLPCIRAVSLKNNGIADEHDREILALMSIQKIKSLDLSCNSMEKMGGQIGKKLRDEVTHFTWIDLTQNLFYNDVAANTAILMGLKKQKELIFAGLTCHGQQSEMMAHLIQPKRPGMALNMRNSTLTKPCMTYLCNNMTNYSYYITALSFKFCYIDFDQILMLGDGLRFNKTIVKLDLSSNALKACWTKFLFEALLDNYCLAHLDLSNNFLDNEFAVDLSHLLESNQTLHTVDISNNPIEPEGAKYLLQQLLTKNDTVESLGDLENTNMLMGVRYREEIRQCLFLNSSNHARKRMIMNQIEQTKHNNPTQKNIKKPNEPFQKKGEKLANDNTFTMDMQTQYPMLKPIAFSNPM